MSRYRDEYVLETEITFKPSRNNLLVNDMCAGTLVFSSKNMHNGARMSKFLKMIFGDPNKKNLAELRADIENINVFEPEMEKLSDEDLKAKTKEFKERLKNGEKLEDMSYEAFAVAREAAKRTLGQRQYDVQLMGGLVLHRGQIAEMRTGEGKTLTSTAPLYTNALDGKGCHLVTVNDYLAMRDAVWMGQVFHFLGMSVGVISQAGGFLYDPDYKHTEENEEEHDEERDATGAFRVHEDYLRPVSRSEAYNADITYGTNNQFGFDYLRDNMAPTLDECVMRDLNYVIVDEIDSILIDEARTPLIISAPAEESNEMYYKFAQIIAKLKEDEHYNVDEKMRAAVLTEAGIEAVEKALNIDNLYAADAGDYQRFADTALRAMANYKKDINYVVKDQDVIIVDEFTGRMMPGRRFSEGIHQSIEAKEGVKIKRESQTLATITFQNFFRMYNKLSGMTGTAETEAEEFGSIYNLEVTVIPTNVPIARQDLTDRVYKTSMGKYQAAIKEIKRLHEKGQPVLVGTASIERNELLSELLRREGIPFNMLNAKNHAKEAEFIAQAGRPGAVTIATNMAGRGVDIALGGNPLENEGDREKVKDSGGLFVLGTDRHESRRIDNQLRGRSGRQGDPGVTQFYLSMEDDLMRIFGQDKAKAAMDRLGIPDDMPIENKMVTGAIEKAQQRVEGHHFDSRKHLLQYDDVLNKHREVVYARRREVLKAHANEPEQLKDRMIDIIESEVEQVVLFHTGETFEGGKVKEKVKESKGWDIKEVIETTQTIIPLTSDHKKTLDNLTLEVAHDKMDLAHGRTTIIETIMGMVKDTYSDVEDLFERDDLRNLERAVILRAIDMLWIDHLADMTALRHGIGLRGYGQRDPLVEYKREGYYKFQNLLGGINGEIAYSFFKHAKHAVDTKAQQELLNRSLLKRAGVRLMGAAKTQGGGGKGDGGKSSEQTFEKVGRNEECPCGSGKKYKKCHGG